MRGIPGPVGAFDAVGRWLVPALMRRNAGAWRERGYRAKTLRINRLGSPGRYRACPSSMESWTVRLNQSTLIASLLAAWLSAIGIGLTSGIAHAGTMIRPGHVRHDAAWRDPDWQIVDWRRSKGWRGWRAASPQLAQRRRRVHAVGRSWHRRGRSWHRRGRSWGPRSRTRRPRGGHFRGRSWHARNRSWHIRGRSW